MFLTVSNVARAASILLALSVPALAADTVRVPCEPIADMKDAGKYRELSHDEFTAARVIFFMAPDTPAAFPPGDAALMRELDDGTASLVFLDGDEACAPVRILKGGVEMMKQLREGVVTHAEGRM